MLSKIKQDRKQNEFNYQNWSKLMSSDASSILNAKTLRNESWRHNATIPSWVNVDKVELDRYFTKPEIAEKCYQDLLSFIKEDGREAEDYIFVEPSAGDGVFADLLPSNRIALDVMSRREDFICEDYLAWQPEKDIKYVVIGNPPFGYRAWLALQFMQHSASFADYIGFILPMSFQSEGKGTPKNRVKGAHMVKQTVLPADSFIMPDGKDKKLNSLWQIWKKGDRTRESNKTCNRYVDLFTVDTHSYRLCGINRLEEADWFLQRTFYGKPPILVKYFDDVKYDCGYGIIFKAEKDKIEKILLNTNWTEYSNLAAHNCRHISMYHIRQAIIDAGFYD